MTKKSLFQTRKFTCCCYAIFSKPRPIYLLCVKSVHPDFGSLVRARTNTRFEFFFGIIFFPIMIIIVLVVEHREWLIFDKQKQKQKKFQNKSPNSRDLTLFLSFPPILSSLTWTNGHVFFYSGVVWCARTRTHSRTLLFNFFHSILYKNKNKKITIRFEIN